MKYTSERGWWDGLVCCRRFLRHVALEDPIPGSLNPAGRFPWISPTCGSGPEWRGTALPHTLFSRSAQERAFLGCFGPERSPRCRPVGKQAAVGQSSVPIGAEPAHPPGAAKVGKTSTLRRLCRNPALTYILLGFSFCRIFFFPSSVNCFAGVWAL